ncbi:aldo/keto reductase, partial [Caldovatus sp. SYSU G05006]|nr:aldo/keto reductase [Caldovatus aquaticus]
MEQRRLGRTGLMVSVLGYGCGAVGGLMVRGTPAEQERAIARAIEGGINYFDTAAAYGDGESERNLGRVLKALGAKDVFVGTKVRVAPAQRGRIGEAVAASLEASLRRLGPGLKPCPQPDGGEGDGGEVVACELVEACGDAAEMLEAIEA